MNSLKLLAAPACALLLLACTSLPAPDYPLQHPANPAAAAAPVDDPRSALADYRPADGRTPSSSHVPTQAHEHAGHHHPATPSADPHAGHTQHSSAPDAARDAAHEHPPTQEDEHAQHH
ncbi:MAG: hypothetical protein KIS79_06580 [Burkholderiales bacterium]|nr:hypothetical protein [Burkholderiales bacterium]